jgi:outer membrane protein
MKSSRPRRLTQWGLLVAMVAWLAPASAWAFKIGYVDLQRALNESSTGKKAKAEFKTKVDGLEKQLKEKKDEVERLKSQLEKQSVVLSDVERRKLEGEFQHKQLDLKRRFEDSQVELQKKDAELTGKILKGLQKIVKDIGDQRGYDLVLELGASPVLYYKKGDDLTEEVLQKYNSGAGE